MKEHDKNNHSWLKLKKNNSTSTPVSTPLTKEQREKIEVEDSVKHGFGCQDHWLR